MLQITLIVFIGCFVLERLFAGWRLPNVHSWYTRVVLINLVQFGVVILAGLSWEKWLSGRSLFHLSNHIGNIAAGFTAYFIATFVFYWWHRVRHESDFFWRWFHQIHHSPQRLEVITSFYKHPQEMIVNSILGSLLIYALLGLNAEAGAIYTLCTALGEFFYHTNIRTPQWIGYIFQRPEMHRIHHQFNYHKNNYGDFVIWDVLFGTYENPKSWEGRCGFTEARELRLSDMLKLKDVHRNSSSIKTLSRVRLAEGDLIFIEIPNLLFRKVAASSRSWTSHVGIILKDDQDRWIVRESKIPFAKDTPLEDYIRRSYQGRFEIRRLWRGITTVELENLRASSSECLNRLYHTGFKFSSKRMFCSKLVYQSYEAAGIQVGDLQSFRDLLRENPNASIRFWRLWFFGFIPWDRLTVTPASQLADEKFVTVHVYP